MQPRNRLGLALVVLGLVAVAGGAWWPVGDAGERVQAADVTPASDAPSGEAPPPEEGWRTALLLVGGTFVASGAGLLLLALLPGRPGGT